MPLLVDGHNLIPKIPGLSLEQIDDEIRLIQLLQEFSRVKRVQIECFFDRAPAGFPHTRRYGMVVAKFARAGRTADGEIRNRLSRLAKEARNWTVVSSDLSVQSAARACGARFLSAERFASDLHKMLRAGPGTSDLKAERDLSPEEVEMWLKSFQEGKPPDQSTSRY